MVCFEEAKAIEEKKETVANKATIKLRNGLAEIEASLPAAISLTNYLHMKRVMTIGIRLTLGLVSYSLSYLWKVRAKELEC